MKPLLKINEAIVQRLLATKSTCTGKLYGTFSKNNLTVIGLSVDNESSANLVYSLPTEIDFCGIFEASDVPTLNKHEKLEQVKEIDVTDNPILLHCKLTEDKNEIIAYVVANDQIEETKFTVITENEIFNQYVHIRLQGSIPINCEAEESAVLAAFMSIRKKVTSGAIGFNFPASSVCILGNEYENHVICSKKDCVFDEFWDDFTGLSDGGRKKKIQHSEAEVININMLQKVTRDADEANHAPLCILNKKPVRALSIAIRVDTLSMIHRQTKITKLYEILIESVVRYLKLFEIKFLNVIKDDMETCSKPETFHFYPDGCGHFLTQIYLNKTSEKELMSERRILHQALLLPENRPIFRRPNAYTFKINAKTAGPLVNPHVGVKLTENGGQVALVKGKYEYYHYCQNKMDDNGWGCAYRSLQTLASWFVLQGYTSSSVPGYPEIQKCLVDIGDKPSSFVGSKQWIGSTEVNFVLNTFLGVTSKILYVSSGEEMATKGPELVYHFENYGSPVMIGGGVLAHTILGVDYNQETGNLMFLILDPHYTGGEDLHVIQSKGWCGWKDANFWNKTAYYNMCLPQVPRDI